MKPVGVKPSVYIGFNIENNKESPIFKVDGHLKISKYKNFLAKCYLGKLVFRNFCG